MLLLFHGRSHVLCEGSATSERSLPPVQYLGPKESDNVYCRDLFLLCLMLLCKQALNESMFGNTECYEGEGLENEDVEYAPINKKSRGGSDSE